MAPDDDPPGGDPPGGPTASRDDPLADDTAAFGLLANETRVDVVCALGDASDENGYAVLPFSDLQEAVGVEDSGQFGYHLRKMEGHFVERTEGGYTLTLPGIQVYQAIVSGTYAPGTTVPPTPVPVTCRSCGEPMQCWYEDYRFYVGCVDCDRVLYRYPLTPGSFDGADDLADAGDRRLKRDYRSMGRRVCPYCAGRVALRPLDDLDRMPSVEIAAEHITVECSCERCHWFLHTSVGSLLLFHPATMSFCGERGFDVTQQPMWSHGLELDESVRSTDPLRIEIRVRVVDDPGTDELLLVVDENFAVVEIDDPDVEGPE